jgi:putative lipoic acid-binding regulatory protein
VRESRAGKYLSISATITARSRGQLDALYRELTQHPMVRVVL